MSVIFVVDDLPHVPKVEDCVAILNHDSVLEGGLFDFGPGEWKILMP